MGILLYAHNEKAYKTAAAMLARTGKAAIIHPTGTGKSFIAFKLAEDHPAARLCWLSPSEYIYKTQTEALTEPLPNISFYTYAKLSILQPEELAAIQADFIILDEFHRCGAEKWGAGVQSLLNSHPAAQVLGLSATNVRYLDNQRDMADELFDGNIASEMSLGEAIVRGILPAPIYVETVYSYQKELEKYQRRVASITEKPIRDTSQQYLDALRRTLEKSEGLDRVFTRHMTNKTGKYIVFCANVEHMREMVAQVPAWFHGVDTAPHVYTVCSDDPETSMAFASFKKDESEHLKLLFCIDMLNEGIHVEGIAGVILFRPTISPIIYKQQIGRALTAGKCQTPLILDVVNNFENLTSIGAIEDEMHTAIQRMYAVGDGEDIVNETFTVLDQVRDCRALFEQLQNSLTASWDQHYMAAREYQAEFGNLNVPQLYKTPGGLSLGRWLTTQRAIRLGRRPGKLTEQQINLLDAIGMQWEDRREAAWERNFKAAKAYYQEYVNLMVPVKYKTKDGIRLGAWISNLRQQRLNGERQGLLNEERIAQLDSIGMTWSAVSTKWEKNYTEASKYYEENGNLLVPATYKTADGFALGSWIRNLRRARYGLDDTKQLTAGQISRLDAIGMCWGDFNDNQWMASYADAKAYYCQYGDLNVPTQYVAPDGVALGKWIARQRYACEKPERSNSKLTPERIRLLNSIGMVWDKPDAWEHRYRLAEQYLAENGNLNIPTKYKTEDGIWLGTWLYRQRSALQGKESNSKLTAEQKNKLKALGDATHQEEAWDAAYQKAKQYFSAQGNLQIMTAYKTPDGFTLGAWISKQRSLYKNKELSAEQIQKLNDIGIVWNPQDIWEKCYTLAAEYLQKSGRHYIPANYKTADGLWLGAWLYRQKKLLQESAATGKKLPPDRRAKIEKLLSAGQMSK